jgi:hypothetical protein
MKKLLLLATATAFVGFAAAPAFAATGDATGTVTVNGNVTAKCSASSSTDTIEVGELSDATGHVVGTFTSSPTAHLTFTCTSALPTVAVTATHLTGPATTDAGYTNVVNYTATVTPIIVGGGPNSALPVYHTVDASGVNSVKLDARLANASNNIEVDVSGPNTDGGLLVASGVDGYTGTVTVTVSPTA